MDKSNNYIDMLNKYPEFDYYDVNFQTRYVNTNNLESFIKNYDLKKLVDKKMFIEVMITICQLVYRLVPPNKPIVHNPYNYSGLELIQLCANGNSLNCAGYSILFNEIILSLGYISKCIFCHPYNLYDDDSHVLCQVFNKDTNAWVVVDPAQGCIPCNYKGEGIDILKLRNLIIKNERLLLKRSTRSYHNDEKRKRYIEYLYKYLFMFIVLDSYGILYDMSTAHLILPRNCNFISYDVPFKCEITNNSFYLFN